MNKKYLILILSLSLIVGLVACSNKDKNQQQEPIKDVAVDQSAKSLYQEAMTNLYYKKNTDSLADVSLKLNGNDATAEETLAVMNDELKKHKYFDQYFNLSYSYKTFEKQDDGSYLLDVSLEFSDGDKLYKQKHLVTFVGQTGNFKISSIDITTGK